MKVYIHEGEPFVAVGIGDQNDTVMVCLMHDSKGSQMMMMAADEWNDLPQFYFTSGTKLSTKTEHKHRPEE